MTPKLTLDQKSQFDRLSYSRRRGADLLEQPYMKGVKSSVTEKYSDQAHFIYELLQNADDVKATKVRFVLTPAGVIFAHNGKIHFSLSNSDTEHEDSQNHRLGHINAITSIGNSSKYAAQIGKFGIGFKAVFQYVETPEIYDPPFFFKIERFIVPVLLTNDHPERRPGETLFYFPFEQRKQPVAQSFQDILDKLKQLVHPLLFLHNLIEITWQVSAEVNHGPGKRGEGKSAGKYTKQVTTATLHKVTGLPAILVERVELTTIYNHHLERKTLWVFNRPLVSTKTLETTHFVSIAYLLNAAGQIQSQPEFPAYCFFPTEKLTKLRFIIQAPFLLTDSREGIRSVVDWNQQLIDYIANLTADSLPILKKLGLLTEECFPVLPLNEADFTPESLFRPVYQAVLQKLQAVADNLLPSLDQEFVSHPHAYLAESHSLMQLLSNAQLAQLLNHPEAKWIFPLTVETSSVWQYAKTHLTAHHGTVTPAYLAARLTSGFFKLQSDAWLIQFYTYLLEYSRGLWNEKAKKDSLRTKPIIRLADNQMVSPYDAFGKVQVYLPADHDSEYPTVKSTLVKEEKALQFLIELGLKQPTNYEEIKYYILPRYQQTEGAIYHAVMLKDFRKLLAYFLDSPWPQREELLKQLKELPFCRARYFQANKTCRVAPQQIYFNTPELTIYFSHYPHVYFLETEFYAPVVQEFGQDLVESFFKALGVANKPRVVKVEARLTQAQRRDLHQGKCTRDYANDVRYTYDLELEGLNELLAHLTPTKAKTLWHLLLILIREEAMSTEIFRGQYKWFYRKEHYHQFDAKFVKLLTTTAWLYDRNNHGVKSSDLIATELADDYDTESYAAKVLLGKLGIAEHRLTGFTLEQKHKYAVGEELFKLAAATGQAPNEVLKRFQEFVTATQHTIESSLPPPVDLTTFKKLSNLSTEAVDLTTFEKLSNLPGTELDLTTFEKLSNRSPDHNDRHLVNKRAVLAVKQAQLEQQLDTLNQLAKWQQSLGHTKKYTLSWFKTLLELESLSTAEHKTGEKILRIQFASVAKDLTAEGILILTDPSRFLPYSLEDIGELSLQLCFQKATKQVLVEVVSVKDLTLRAKLTAVDDLPEIEVNQVRSAILEIKQPGFILEHLKTAFQRLPYPDDYDLQSHLPETIEFILGPPGTGKTTYLAQEKIIPWMKSPEQRQILVLTPTNKAADVLFRKILAGLTDEQPKWLIRFGLTNDSEIERAGWLKNKYFDLTRLKRCVVVTTLARFIYDGFRGNVSSRLKNYRWDVIIVDEASMIMLASLVYVLYQQPHCHFIIAGDPLQIQPIVSASQWQEDNIYTLVGLHNFVEPRTTPHAFPVTVLTTQYRSIPPIGNLFSHFSYQGILSHSRPLNTKRPLRIKQLNLKPITVIHFPVNQFERIYQAQRLEGGSAYQIYSAIFTVELALYLARNLREQPPPVWRIGIICPYLAQANLVEKMLAAQWPVNSNVAILSGTIHSFQGDDCDILLNLLNPPPTVGPEIFLNKQHILNVSISRARDYLILIVPEVAGIAQLERLQGLLKHPAISPYCQWFTAADLERVMFKTANYIYDNSLVTSHQPVNVYGQPTKKYEIRCEDKVIDIQLKI